MDDDLDVGDGDVRVGVQKVLAEDAGVQLWGVDGVLLGLDVDCVFDGVCGDYDAVVCLGVSGGRRVSEQGTPLIGC